MRVKRGQIKRVKHKKVLKQAKGYRLSYSKLYRRAREALLHAGEYNFAHRKKRQSQYRRIWIQQINAACRASGTSYSRFMHAMKTKDIALDRKVLAYLAVNKRPAFDKLLAAVTS